MTTPFAKYNINQSASSLHCQIFTDQKFQNPASKFSPFIRFALSTPPSTLKLYPSSNYTLHICSKKTNGATFCHRAYQIPHSALKDRISELFFEVTQKDTSTTLILRSDLELKRVIEE